MSSKSLMYTIVSGESGIDLLNPTPNHKCTIVLDLAAELSKHHAVVPYRRLDRHLRDLCAPSTEFPHLDTLVHPDDQIHQLAALSNAGVNHRHMFRKDGQLLHWSRPSGGAGEVTVLSPLALEVQLGVAGFGNQLFAELVRSTTRTLDNVAAHAELVAKIRRQSHMRAKSLGALLGI